MVSRGRWYETLRSLAAAVASRREDPIADPSRRGRALASPRLTHAIAAPRRILRSANSGRISFYEDASATGPTVLLVHGLGLLGSSAELAPLFDALRDVRRVAVVDLPGYAFSVGCGEPVSRDTYVRAVTEVVNDLSRRHEGRVDVVAVGASGEFPALAAQSEARAAIRSIAIVGRQGLSLVPPSQRPRHPVETLGATLLGFPRIGALLHRALATPPLLRAFVEAESAIRADDRVVAYLGMAARESGASVAALAALAGVVTRGDTEELFARLPVPVCFVRGASDATERATALALVAGRSDFRFASIDGACARPHLEQPRATADALLTFWSGLVQRPQLRLIRGDLAGSSRPDARRPRRPGRAEYGR